MNKLRILSMTIYLLLTSCTATMHHKAPAWTLDPPKMASEGLYVTGVGYPCPNERMARESALQEALTEFLRYTGVEVSSYVKMSTHETAKDNQSGKVEMNNTEVVTLATQGFVQKVRQMEWSLGTDNNGQTVGYVRILVPRAEVARVETEQISLRKAKREPFKRARQEFSQAIHEHRLSDAAQMLDPLVVLADQANMGVITREQLVAEINSGLTLETFGVPGYNLDQGGKAQLSVRVTHKGDPVPNLPVVIVVPSGHGIKTVTETNGIATATIPCPTRAGDYPLVVRTRIEGLIDLTKTISYPVSGTNEKLSEGQFHPFIEVQATGSADPKSASRYQAEELALQTARQLAYAQLLQKRQGLNISTQTNIDGRIMTRSQIRSESAGHVDAQAVEEKVVWEQSRPVATVVYRMAL